jgi:hypothetical protein
MCIPIGLAIAGITAATSVYTVSQQRKAQKEASRQQKKIADQERDRALAEGVRADIEAKEQRTEGYAARRSQKAAGQAQIAGTAQSFGARSFFSPA